MHTCLLMRYASAGAATRLLQRVAAAALPDHPGGHAGRLLGAPVSARADQPHAPFVLSCAGCLAV